MKVGEIWKAKDELKSFKNSPGFWDDPDNEDLLMTTDYIKLIEYIGDDGWRVQPMYPNAKIEELREKHKKNSALIDGSRMYTKFICEPRSERLHGSVIHKHYICVGADASSYGPEPAYEMIFDGDSK
jgi:hypothetical protein